MAELPTPRGVAGTNRLETFSDGVIAIIVTLLIFEIRVPALREPTSAGWSHFTRERSERNENRRDL